MNSKIVAWFKVATSLMLLVWLLRSVAWSNLVAALLKSDSLFFVVAFAFGLGHILLSALRWQILLYVLGSPRVPLRMLVRFYLVGSFFNNLAPANLGGDISRTNALFQRGTNTAHAVSSVVAERMLNLFGLGLLGLWALVAQPIPLVLPVDATILQIGIMMAAILLVVILSIGYYWRMRLQLVGSQFLAILSIAKQHLWGLAGAIVLTMLLHIFNMLITTSTLLAVSLDPPLDAQLAIYAVAGLAIALPVSVQGVGIREGAYVGLLGILGIPKEPILAALALNYAILLLISTIGVILFWLSPPKADSQTDKPRMDYHLMLKHLLTPDFPLGKLVIMRKALADSAALLILHPTRQSLDFARLVLQVKPQFTMVQNRNLMTLYQLVQQVNLSDVPGDIVECGVWNGGSAVVMAIADQRHSKHSHLRTLWLFDSFQGLPRPGDKDGIEERKIYFDGWNKGDIKNVREIFGRLRISTQRYRIVPGWFDTTLATAPLSQIAILHIDADWYDSVKIALEVFYPKVTPGGFIVLDDYGCWQGCDQALADYFAEEGIYSVPVIRVGSIGAYFQKPRTLATATSD